MIYVDLKAFPLIFGPAYFDVSGIRVGHIVPPYISLGLVGLGFQFFSEIPFMGVIYHIQKDS